MDTTFIWLIIFVLSLAALVKGADWLLRSSEKIGLAIGLSPFVIGVLVVSLGTSFPELVAAFFASFRGVAEFAPANAVGSNVANILLVVGVTALLSKKIRITRELIDVELPLLAIGTVIFLGVAWNGQIIFWEAALMVLVYVIYLFYIFIYQDGSSDTDSDHDSEEGRLVPSRFKQRGYEDENGKTLPQVSLTDLASFFLGALFLVLGSHYLVDSVQILGDEFRLLDVGGITIIGVAIGTSLPELLVSVKAAVNHNSEMALGNIFGSNAFNMLMVVGLPGLFFGAELDTTTLEVGLPALAAVTLLFVITGISQRIHMWEGAFFLMLYILFISMLLGVS